MTLELLLPRVPRRHGQSAVEAVGESSLIDVYMVVPTYDKNLLSHSSLPHSAECLESLKCFLASHTLSVLSSLGIPDLNSRSDQSQPLSSNGC